MQCRPSLKYSCTLEHFYLQCSSMFSLVCYRYLTLFESVLRIKNKKKIRNWGWFQFFLERAKFYAECNNYSYAAPNGVF